MSITVISVVLVYIQMIGVTKMLADKQQVKTMDDEFDNKERILKERFQNVLYKEAQDIYKEMGQPGSAYREEYYRQYIKRIDGLYGNEEKLKDILKSWLSEETDNAVVIGDAPKPHLEMDFDEDRAVMSSVKIEDIILWYMEDGEVKDQRMFDLTLEGPKSEFEDEEVSLYDYNLIGFKGIYITGDTSSFMGNTYAGTHLYEEGREEEVEYGEKDPYGGINVLRTQMAFCGDVVATEGDINIKGSFVSFGDEEDKICLYANTMNVQDDFTLESEYKLNGKAFLRDGSVKYTNEAYYKKLFDLMKETEGRISVIMSYYGSDEDPAYTGNYQKIISNEDVVLKKDYKGVIITAGNITIESDINTEGLLIAGGRIYLKGNNNIVSDPDILKDIMEYEESNGGAENSGFGRNIGDYINKL
ncbi:MAG: hypothetical protein K6E98_09925 [Lachnospiraceae bacterium]|nr:hypothetical protein [Lachnospiraceae bacterium]